MSRRRTHRARQNENRPTIDQWYRDVEEAAAEIDPEDAERLRQAIEEIRREGKEQACREMGWSSSRLTEDEWLTCTDPVAMLQFLRGRASNRKSRLFVCACCRLVWDRLIDRNSRVAVEAAERYEDEVAEQYTDWARGKKRRAAALPSHAVAEPSGYSPAWAAHHATAVYLWEESDRGVSPIVAVVRIVNFEITTQTLSNLLRDVFNPFCPVATDPAWLAWRDGVVVKLAKAIYQERRFSELPILADALEEAGCDNADMLAHCRQPGEHVRGCWVVDALLGKA